MQLQVASAFGKRQGITTINEYDDASLEKAVRRAETLAQLAPENPEYMPLLGPQNYGPAANTYIPATAAIDSRQRADIAGQSLQHRKRCRSHRRGFPGELRRFLGPDELARSVYVQHRHQCRFFHYHADDGRHGLWLCRRGV